MIATYATHVVLERDASASRLHLVNTVLACRRYYLDGASKSEIATELGVSRFKVARMLDKARRDGIVRIDIDPLPDLDLDLGDELARRHGIRGAIVVRATPGPSRSAWPSSAGPRPRSSATSSRPPTSWGSAGAARSTRSSGSCRGSPPAPSSSSWAASPRSSSR